MAASAQQIEDALAGRHGPTSTRYRVEQRAHDYALLADMTAAVQWPGAGGAGSVSAPRIAVDNDSAVIRTCSLVLDEALLPADFDPGSDHIAIIEERLVSGDWVQFPQGLYHLDVRRDTHLEGRDLIEAEGSDLTLSHLANGTTAEAYSVAAGTNYIAAVESILDAQGVEHALPAAAEETGLEHTWGPGTPWIEIVGALCYGINRYPPWPDERGRFVTRERADPSTEIAVINYRDTVEPRLIIAPQPYLTALDAGQFPNRAAVLIDDPRHADFGFALAENDDASSPVSTVSEGVQLDEINGDAGPRTTKAIFGSAVAAEIAAFELQDAAGRALSAELATFADPRLGARGFVVLDISGVEDATLWTSRAWQRELVPGATMRHELTRASAVSITAL